MRPRLRMDGATGTEATGGKFDVTALLPGTKGTFELVWQGNEPGEEIAPVIETYLAALQAGHIRLGAQKSNGFGRVSLDVTRRRYDLHQPEDLEAWLEDAPVEEPVALEETGWQDGIVEFQVTARLDRLLVKASESRGTGKDKVDASPMVENGKLLLPGSSLKGAIRAQMYKIAPYCLGSTGEACLEHFLGRASQKGKDGDGDNGIAGKARFSDGVFGSEKALATLPRAHRVRINRLTGGVMDKALFCEQPVTDTVEWTITAPAGEPAGCALLLFALRDLGLGLYSLGSGAAIGHGRAEWVRVKVSAPGRQTITLESSPDAVTLEDPDGVGASWLEACKEAKT